MAQHDPFRPFEEKLRSDGAPSLLVETFRRQYAAFRSGQTGLIPVASVSDVGSLPNIEELGAYDNSGREALTHALMLKLNGGLGTGMGLDRAKSLLPVKNGLHFLDIIARQVLRLRAKHRISLPLLLMNSFGTEQDSLNALARYPDLRAGQRDIPLSFLQHRVPKIRRDDLAPVHWPADPEKEWCPPGHGDLYIALLTTGLLRRLLDDGFQYAFISNADNLGATLDIRILGYMAEKELPFIMEVTDRTEADKKGGHLAKSKDGRLLLRELAHCPPDETDDFQDIRKHRFFNTNNLWVNLKAVERVYAGAKPPDLALIINRKNVDPRDPASPAVIQLETAMGSAISVFDGAQALRVPRSRFAPVKTTDDLLALWSDAYVLTDAMHMALHPKRNGVPPVIRLDPRYYKMIADFTARFPAGAPSLLECESLSVEGDFRFGRNIRVKGLVELKNPGEKQIILADDAVYAGS